MIEKVAIFMMGLILVILVLIIPIRDAISEEAQKFDQESLNKKLRSVNEQGEFDEQKATIAEVLVMKNETKAMEQLNRLLSKYRNTPIEAGLLFRKAELYVRQSKTARFFEFSKDDSKLLTLIPKTALKSNPKQKLTQAVDIYESIQKRHPNYSDLDLVLFNNAFIRQQLDQEKTAEKIYRNLLTQFPESYLVPETHLALGEMLYQQRRYQEALKDYESAKKYTLSRAYAYAVYKTAWTKYQLKDVDGAVTELETVIAFSDGQQSNPEVSENVKVNLKNEALQDLVLFYPEAREAKNAYAYFKKWAREDAGKYILTLAQMYERHSKYKEQETVLFDFINGSPKSKDAPLAWKAIIETDIQVKDYLNVNEHLVKFEAHCLKHFENEYDELKKTKSSVAKNAIKVDLNEEETCPGILTKQSLRISQKWHNDWKKKFSQLQKAEFDKKDKERVQKIGDGAETSYAVYLRNSFDKEKIPMVRFNYAELLFQRKKFRVSSDEYYKAALDLKDEKIRHDASYFAIVSLESAVGEKWSDKDEDRYIELADLYLKYHKTGKFVTDIKYKRAFIAYEKGRYNEALPAFKQIGWANQGELALKSQDLYLDILNIQKKYKELIEATDHLISLKPQSERRIKLLKIYRESYFTHTNNMEKEGELDEASSNYYKFALQNKDSNLADKAFWNHTQILIKQNKLHLAASRSLELYKTFPQSEFAKKSLLKSVELFEFTGQTKEAALASMELAKADAKETIKWQKLSADFFVVSGEYARAVSIYKELLKLPDSKMRDEISDRLVLIKQSGSYSNKDLDQLLAKYSQDEGRFLEIIQKAEQLYFAKDYSKAFKMASEIVGEKEAPREIQARARLVQADILMQEFESQSTKTKVERIQVVLSLKTEKLDKAQRAYQSVIKYGVPQVALKAFLNLAKMYEHYVESLKNIEITDAISEKDKEVLTSEISNIVIPIEEKITETLQQGVDFAKKYPVQSESALALRNELNRLNFKGYRYVEFNLDAPKMALPKNL